MLNKNKYGANFLICILKENLADLYSILKVKKRKIMHAIKKMFERVI